MSNFVFSNIGDYRLLIETDLFLSTLNLFYAMLHYSAWKFSLLVLFVGLVSCTNVNRPQGESTQTNKSQSVSSKVITRTFPAYADFTQITNIGSMHIDISKGPFEITATGDSVLLSNLIYDIDGGCLTLSFPSEENVDVNSYELSSNVRVHVSMPQVNILTNCGSGTINYKGTLTTDDLHIGGIGTGWIHVDSIECDDFKYESTRRTDARFRHIRCNEAVVIAAGGAKTDITVNASRSAAFMLSGVSHINAQSKAPFIDLISSDDAKGDFHLEADSISLYSNGTSVLTLNGHARISRIKTEKTSHVNNKLRSDKEVY